jgi:hypothetical protein
MITSDVAEEGLHEEYGVTQLVVGVPEGTRSRKTSISVAVGPLGDL